MSVFIKGPNCSDGILKNPKKYFFLILAKMDRNIILKHSGEIFGEKYKFLKKNLDLDFYFFLRKFLVNFLYVFFVNYC